MSTPLHQALENLSIADKRALGEVCTPLIAEPHTVLRARLAYHRAHPDEPGVTVAELKAHLMKISH